MDINVNFNNRVKFLSSELYDFTTVANNIDKEMNPNRLKIRFIISILSLYAKKKDWNFNVKCNKVVVSWKVTLKIFAMGK